MRYGCKLIRPVYEAEYSQFSLCFYQLTIHSF